MAVVVCLVAEESFNLLPLALIDVDISSISNLVPELGKYLCQLWLCLVCQTVLVLLWNHREGCLYKGGKQDPSPIESSA